MFKMVTGGNGRSVYCGLISQANDKAMEIKGTEYNPEEKVNEDRKLQLFFSPEVDSKEVKPGGYAIAMVMPHRSNPLLGTAEEVGLNNQAIVIKNEKGNEKVIILAKVYSLKWNEKRTKLVLSFLNVHDMEGKPIGYESVYERNGETQKTYWLNVNFFPEAPNSTFKNRYTAERVSNEIHAGDTVAMVLSRKDAQYNGTTYINYNGNKYMVVNKAEAQKPDSTMNNIPKAASTPKNTPKPETNTTSSGELEFDFS